MHIFGNIDTLEIPSILIDTDAYINNNLPLYADQVLQRDSVNKDLHLTPNYRATCITYLFVWWFADQLNPGLRLTQHSLISLITKGHAKLYFDSNRNLFRSINKLSELKIPILP